MNSAQMVKKLIYIDVCAYVTAIMVGNNKYVARVSKGDFLQQNGTSIDPTLHEVLYIPKLMLTVLSFTKHLRQKILH
jgi:hypothetical protein